MVFKRRLSRAETQETFFVPDQDIPTLKVRQGSVVRAVFWDLLGGRSAPARVGVVKAGGYLKQKKRVAGHLQPNT